MNQITGGVMNGSAKFGTPEPTWIQSNKTPLASQRKSELACTNDPAGDDQLLFKPHDFLLLDLLALQSEGDVYE